MNRQYDITFETKCYENDWEYMLKTKYLDDMVNLCHYDFSFKQLIINNVNEPELVKKYAQKKVDKGVIDAFYFVDDYIDQALKEFQIEKESFGKGYYYSSAELVGIYLSKTKYHLHFSSDAMMARNQKSLWISEACHLLELDPQYLVANAVWNNEYRIAKSEAVKGENDNFFIGYGFSDQCYLIRTTDFKKPIYNCMHPDSERYPKYGGELFEKRVDSYMRVNGLCRLTSNSESYEHRNFPKNPENKVLKKIILLLINMNIYSKLRNLKKYIQHKFR